MCESREMSADLDSDTLSEEHVDLDWLGDDSGGSLSDRSDASLFSTGWHVKKVSSVLFRNLFPRVELEFCGKDGIW